MDETDLKKSIEYGQVIATLVRDKVTLKAAMQAYDKQDIKELKDILQKLHIEKYCKLVCWWFCEGRCWRMCKAICPQLP